MKNIDYALGDNSVFIYDRINSKAVEITNDRINYKPVIEAIKDNDEEGVLLALDEKKVLNIISDGKVVVNGDKVFFNGAELHSAEAAKLVQLVSEGITDISRWCRFIERLHANPSYHCREQAYNFIAHSGMPITNEGKLIGYKGVQENYYSKYGNKNNVITKGIVNEQGQILNTVGSTIEMPRSNVDDNPNNGCSSGLHVGSHDYADSWASSDGNLMIVEYCPSDIVSVPSDCNHSKLRVCKYTVVAQSTNRQELNSGAYGNSIVDNEDLFNYIENNANCNGGVYYSEIKSTFPGVTMLDVKEAIEENCEYHLDCQWNSDNNDYIINIQSLPS